jgi:hypothetical protein
MQGRLSSWFELTDSTSLRDFKKVIESVSKLVVRDSDFECVNFTFDEATQRLLRYEAIYWDSEPPDYLKLLRRTSNQLWPEEWLLFEEKRSKTFCPDCHTLRVILVTKDLVYTIDGSKLNETLNRRMLNLGDVNGISFQES